MQLGQLFGASYGPLLDCAAAVDDGERFRADVRARPLDARLARAVRRASRKFAERAGIDDGELTSGAFAGQQPYVDYYPAVPAKLDALEECGGFYAFATYAPFGSDRWMDRSEMPSVTAAGGLLRLAFHRPARVHEGKDFRFVPVPSSLREIEEKLKAMISATANVVALDRKKAFARLRLLLADYEFAREHAANAGEFNAIWSARTFRRIGLRVPLLSLTDLLEDDEMLPIVHETLQQFARERRAIEQCLRALDRPVRHEGPLAIADENGVRRFTSDVVDLEKHRGRWSLDIFTPVFLFRLGVTGIVNGRGSIRYSLALAKVMDEVFGERHPPNLLCSCAPRDDGPFARAAKRTDGEPTLIQRLLVDEPAVIRAQIAESWR